METKELLRLGRPRYFTTQSYVSKKFVTLLINQVNNVAFKLSLCTHKELY